jgi:hypothetical protein
VDFPPPFRDNDNGLLSRIAGGGVDPRTRLFLCVLGSAGFFAVIGGLFGAITGAITWRDGRAAGTVVGFSVARAFARLSENGLTRSMWGVLVGGTDGVIFGQAIGVVLGLIAGWAHPAEWETLRPFLLGSMLLAGAALIFGLMAGGLAVAGSRSLAGLFVGGISGALLGIGLAGVDGLVIGMFAGSVTGTILFVSLFRRRGRKPSESEDQSR